MFSMIIQAPCSFVPRYPANIISHSKHMNSSNIINMDGTPYLKYSIMPVNESLLNQCHQLGLTIDLFKLIMMTAVQNVIKFVMLVAIAMPYTLKFST